MDAPHRIRLHGPWTAQSSREGSPPHVLPMPGPVPFVVEFDSREVLAFERGFGRPTNLTGETSVELVIEGLGAVAEVILNGSSWKAVPGNLFRAEIAPILENRNLLCLMVDGPVPGLIPFAQLYLEIAGRSAMREV